MSMDASVNSPRMIKLTFLFELATIQSENGLK